MKTILMNRAAFSRALANVGSGTPMNDQQRKAMFAQKGRGGGMGGGGGGGGGGDSGVMPSQMAGYSKEKQRQAFEKKQAAKSSSSSGVTLGAPSTFSMFTSTSGRSSVPSVRLPFGQGDAKLDRNPNINPPGNTGRAPNSFQQPGSGVQWDPIVAVQRAMEIGVNWDPQQAVRIAQGKEQTQKVQAATRPLIGSDPITWSPSRPLIGSDPITWSPTGKKKQTATKR
ncbi:MAG: hypothetical protein V2A34_14655 [Lentisphaerota bacterium]